MRRSTATVVSGPAGRTDRLQPVAIVWLVAVGSLPLLELGFLSVSIDSSALVARGGPLSSFVDAAVHLVRAAVPVLAALVLIGAARLPQVASAIGPALETSRRPWGALAGHLVCAGIVAWLTRIVFSGPQPAPATLVAWLSAGALAVALWFAALLPGIMRRGPRALFAATVATATGLGLLAAGAATVTREWWRPFAYATLGVVYEILRSVGYEVGAEPARFQVGTPRFVVEIAPHCSGYQGIGLILVFLGAFLYLFRDRLRFPRAFWLLPIGAVLVWVLNAVRIALLVALGDAGHEQIAVQGFHYNAGTLLFCVTALGLGAWAVSSRTFSTVAHDRFWAADNPTPAYVVPFVALLGMSLVTGLVSRGGFDPLYGLRVLVAVGALWAFRGQLSSAGWRVSWSGVGIGVVAFGVWLALAGREYLSHDFGPALARLDPAMRIGWVAQRLLGSVVVVPLVEELAFRGYLARRLTAADFESVPLDRVSWPALIAAAAVFGLMHTDVAAGAAVGVLYGVAARRRGQLGDAVVAHGVTNALLAVTVLSTGGSSLWE